MKLTILGAPRTKKNSPRIVRTGNRSRLIQSAAAIKWAEDATLQLQAHRHRLYGSGPHGSSPPFKHPVNLCALVYRDKAVGDLGNYLAAICDALQAAGIVEDDKFIEGFDGSRPLVDRHNPRVEIELTPIAHTEAT